MIVYDFLRGDRRSMSESDVCRRQIQTSKVGLRTQRNKIFIMVVDITNEAERADWDIYDDFKLKKKLWSPWFMPK